MDDNFAHSPEPGSPAPHIAFVALVGALVLALLLVAMLGYRSFTKVQPVADPTGGNPSKPSIVVILTDDQRWDTLWAMPTVQQDLVDHGVTFENSFVVNSACCPSRASILTGQYSHSTGVYTNRGSEGGFRSFNDGSTMATWLESDYTSALVGKYLNNYEFAGTHGEIPLGWDHWVAFPKAHYDNFALNIDGTIEQFGSATADYSTDVLADQAVKFIQGTDGPLLLYFSPKAPHYPAQPKGADKAAFAHLAKWRPRSYNEADMSDKPQWAQDLLPLTAGQQRHIDRFRLAQMQTLLPVDRAVGRIVDALQQTGRLDNTMIVFMSDNGMLWGEHRMTGKGNAYEESIRVPMVVRYDPLVTQPVTSDDLVLNIDVAPTAADLAGVHAPGAEGSSLVPLLQDPGAPWRTDFLVEHFSPGGPRGNPPTFCAIRTDRYKYVDYMWGEDELYDLKRDRFEMSNLIYDPSMSHELDQLRQDETQLCDPPPPRKLDYYARN